MALIKVVKVKKIVDALLGYIKNNYVSLKTSYKNLQITGIASSDGDIILTVGANTYNISVLTTDTVSDIITKILAETYTDYTTAINGTDSVDFVTSGTAVLSFDANGTGVTGTVTDREEDTFLYQLLGDNIEGDYNFYTQAQEIFLRDDENPRSIRTSLMFNKNTKGEPHIHVREASRPKGTFNSIGGIQGEHLILDDGSFNEQYRDTKRGAYEIIVTSKNPLDTILIAEVIYTLMWGAYETLANEFSTFDFSLKELIFQNELAASLYAKAITLDTQQENIIPSLINNTVLDQVNFVLSNINGEDLST